MSVIKVQFTYDFEFDPDGFDPEFVDIEGLARDSALISLKQDLEDGYFTAEDFEIEPDNLTAVKIESERLKLMEEKTEILKELDNDGIH